MMEAARQMWTRAQKRRQKPGSQSAQLPPPTHQAPRGAHMWLWEGRAFKYLPPSPLVPVQQPAVALLPFSRTREATPQSCPHVQVLGPGGGGQLNWRVQWTAAPS